MSTLTSSALGGSKAKPKAPPRRRAPLPAAPATVTPQAAIENTESTLVPAAVRTQQKDNANSVAYASLQGNATVAAHTSLQDHTNVAAHTSVQDNANVAAQTSLPPPSPPAVIERPVAVTDTAIQAIPSSAPTSATVITNIQNEAQPAVSQSTESAVAPAQDAATSSVENTSSTRKRTRQAPSKTTANKRARVSAIEDVVASEPSATQEQAQEPSTTEGETARTAIRRSRRHGLAQDDAPEAPRATIRKPRKPRKANAAQEESVAPTAPINPAEVLNAGVATPPTPTTITTELATKPRRKARKRKHAPVQDVEAPPEPEVEEEEDEEEDPENHQIDPQSLSMFDLSHDAVHGKTSEREKKMAKIDWAAVARKRREEADAIMRGDTRNEPPNVVESTEDADGQAQQDEDGEEEEQDTTRPAAITRASGGGVRFRLVGGQIVEDETSLTIDRAARIVEATADEEPAVEEDDLTVRFNRTTYINARKRDETERVPLWRSKSDTWSEEETDRFYDALRMFGTDFFIISKMFPPKTRRQIKHKFVREERLEPDRINETLLGKKTEKIDIDQYAQAINRDVNDFHKYDSLAHANEVIKASMKDKEEAMRAAVKEEDENNRQREVQRQQREKQRLEAEKKKEERARKKSAKHRGEIYGTGTFGGADDDAADVAS